MIQDQSGKEYKMDHVQVRFPTNVEDVARVLYDLTRKSRHGPTMYQPPNLTANSGTFAPLGTDHVAGLSELPPILHYSTPSPPMTKYEMTGIIAKHLDLPISHVVAVTEKPTGEAATQRPENSQLSSKKLEEIGVDVSEAQGFDSWWKEYSMEIKTKKA